MTWDAFFDEIKAGGGRSAYLFAGQEEYVKNNAVRALEKALLPEGLEALNYRTIEGGVAADIIEACETMPLMCEKRLVVAKDYAPLMSGKARDEAAETERMCAWLANPPATCCLVFFVRGDADGRKKLVTELNKSGAFVRFDPLDDARIAQWAKGQLKPLGKSIAPDALNQLVFMAGRALTTLEGEMAKLASYAGDRPLITVNDVEKVVTPVTEYTVFQMIDMLMAGDALGAHRLLKAALERGESRVGVIAMLTRQMRMLTHICVMKSSGAKLGQIEKRLELSHFVASRAEKQASRFSAESAMAGYRACVDADYAVKTGRARDEQALNGLMLLLPAQPRNFKG